MAAGIEMILLASKDHGLIFVKIAVAQSDSQKAPCITDSKITFFVIIFSILRRNKLSYKITEI